MPSKKKKMGNCFSLLKSWGGKKKPTQQKEKPLAGPNTTMSSIEVFHNLKWFYIVSIFLKWNSVGVTGSWVELIWPALNAFFFDSTHF